MTRGATCSSSPSSSQIIQNVYARSEPVAERSRWTEEERDALEGHLDESATAREVFLRIRDDRVARHIRGLLSRII